jgi:hypothetical protein
VGRDGEAVSQCGCSDPEVVGADTQPAPAEVSPHLGVNAGDGLGNGNGLEPGEHVLDERAPTSAVSACRPVHTVEQLADGYDADGACLVAE